jgi:hypothetical protein
MKIFKALPRYINFPTKPRLYQKTIIQGKENDKK